MPNCARAALETVPLAVEELARVGGKTRAYNRAGDAPPPGISALGPGAWRGDKPLAERGFASSRKSCWQLPDLECLAAVPLLRRALGARLIRTVPPSQSAAYAEAGRRARAVTMPGAKLKAHIRPPRGPVDVDLIIIIFAEAHFLNHPTNRAGKRES